MSNDTSEGKKAGGGISAQRKESSVELQKMMDSLVLVKCLGGRELKGVLRGFDDLFNLVLEDSEEYLRGMFHEHFVFPCFCQCRYLISITYFSLSFCFTFARSRNSCCYGKDTKTWSCCYKRNSSFLSFSTGRS